MEAHGFVICIFFLAWIVFRHMIGLFALSETLSTSTPSTHCDLCRTAWVTWYAVFDLLQVMKSESTALYSHFFLMPMNTDAPAF